MISKVLVFYVLEMVSIHFLISFKVFMSCKHMHDYYLRNKRRIDEVNKSTIFVNLLDIAKSGLYGLKVSDFFIQDLTICSMSELEIDVIFSKLPQGKIWLRNSVKFVKVLMLSGSVKKGKLHGDFVIHSSKTKRNCFSMNEGKIFGKLNIFEDDEIICAVSFVNGMLHGSFVGDNTICNYNFNQLQGKFSAKHGFYIISASFDKDELKSFSLNNKTLNLQKTMTVPSILFSSEIADRSITFLINDSEICCKFSKCGFKTTSMSLF